MGRDDSLGFLLAAVDGEVQSEQAAGSARWACDHAEHGDTRGTRVCPRGNRYRYRRAPENKGVATLAPPMTPYGLRRASPLFAGSPRLTTPTSPTSTKCA
jgi:hypothetical protein